MSKQRFTRSFAKIRSRFLKVQSSNLDFFFHREVLHMAITTPTLGVSNVIFTNFEKILEIPLTSIKQTSLIHSIYGAPDQKLVQSMFKIGRKAAELEKKRSLQSEIRKEESKTKTKKIRKTGEDDIRKRCEGWKNEEPEAGRR